LMSKVLVMTGGPGVGKTRHSAHFGGEGH
jgi:hypothetical protein